MGLLFLPLRGQVALAISLALVLSSCGGSPSTPPDSDVPDADAAPDGTTDGDVVCSTDADCDDGVFCNGAETCEADVCVVPGASPCATGSSCDEVTDSCEGGDCDNPDADGDGFDSVACGGSDCDDSDSARFPGNPEVCDAANHDEDCDPVTFGIRDADGDGSPDARCCNEDDSGTLFCGDDCDDTRAGVNTDNPEVCNGRDDDCDGSLDEGVLTTLYRDGDGDGFGDADMSMEGCAGTVVGYVEVGTDCDDGEGSINPGAVDICDAAMVDQDCNGVPNDPPLGCSCTTGASQGCVLPGICAAGTELCVDGTWGACSIMPEAFEICDGEDDDCNGTVDDGLRRPCWPDGDLDGFALDTATPSDECMTPSGGCPSGFTPVAPLGANADCDDASATRSPGATEICNGQDDNCDGVVDEGLTLVCYADADNDTYAVTGTPATNRCPAAGRDAVAGCPSAFTNRAPSSVATTDCNDDSSAGGFSINPGITEVCDSVDNDCDGSTDEGLLVTLYRDDDGDGFGDPTMSMMACPGSLSGWVPTSTDCDDGNVTINPSATDICDAAMVDEDCSGTPNDPPGGCACTMGMSEGCPQPGICSAGTRDCIAGTWGACSIAPEAVETCDGEDDDCNGVVDDGLRLDCWDDGDNDGFALAAAVMSQQCRTGGSCPANFTNVDPAISADCDDVANTVFPGASESPCNRVDNDCDGTVDEGLTVTCYVDDDDDSYSPMGAVAAQHCPVDGRGLRGGCPIGFTNRAPAGQEDCADDVFVVNPGMVELCEDPPTTDEDCDGLINPMSDCDCGVGMTRACPEPGVCASGTQTCVAGAWGACTITPTIDTCNGLDDDCDGSTDEIAGGVCALGSPAIPCTTTCGLGGTAGTQTCLNCFSYETCRSADEGDGFAGSCNGCDDDLDGSTDEGFFCARDLTQACTNSCGNAGTQTCNSTCAAWGTCRGAEVCDYCDDNGVAGLEDDAALALTTYLRRFRTGGLTQLYGSAGPISTQTELHDRDVVNSVGATYVDPHVLGYGDLVITARVTAQRNPCTASEVSGGWAVVVFANLTTNYLGGVNEYGVPRSNEGISVEWRHNNGGANKARMWRLSLWGAVSMPENDVSPDLIRSSSPSSGNCSATQQIDVTITPDNPDTSGVNETAVIARDGLGNFIGSCSGSSCGTLLQTGQEVMIGVTGSSNNGRRATHVLSGITSQVSQTQTCL